MVSIPAQGASRAVINAVCHGSVVRCAAPLLPAKLQRDLSNILDLQRTHPHKYICGLPKSRRGLVIKAAEGNGASPSSTGLSIDLTGDATDAVFPSFECTRSPTTNTDTHLLLVKARRRSLPVLRTIRWARDNVKPCICMHTGSKYVLIHSCYTVLPAKCVKPSLTCTGLWLGHRKGSGRSWSRDFTWSVGKSHLSMCIWFICLSCQCYA